MAKIQTVYAIHACDAAHLRDVMAEMQTRGAPRIEVVDCGDHYMALEGCHRLLAAERLGLIPEFVVHEQDDMLDITRFDWFEPNNWAATEYPAGEVAGEIYSPHSAQVYRFGE